MAAKNSRQEMINRIRAKYRNLRFDHFHYRGLTHKSVFHCVQCGLNFRQTPDSLLLRRKDGTIATPACGCRLELVSEWDLPEKHEESENE
jgi:hypothetical protein